KRRIINDMKVELADEFDRNFERKGFFSKKWQQRANTDPKAKGTLLMVTGTLRRSIRGEVTGDGVRFTSAVPYAKIHNEGGEGRETVGAHYRTSRRGRRYLVRAHTRRFSMPERRFVGDADDVRRIIQKSGDREMARFERELTKKLRAK
ncbi:MAG: phage virion morphogenesis protein, partial [Prevotellaceae bacterium]|nr:phage virion morphogenesis protein [Prevotellaceae bacterium]